MSGRVRGYTCDPKQQAYIPVSGSLNSGQLVLNSGTANPIENFSLNASVSASLTSFQGQLMYSSSPCNSYQTYGVTGQHLPSVAGNWSGTAVSASGPVATITASISEAGPDSSGFPALSGNVTFSGLPCFTQGNLSGNQVGIYVNASISTTNGTILIPLGSALNSTGQLAISYSVEGGTCNGDSGSGMLSRQ